MKVTIYTSPHCPFSKKAKEFLRRKRITFVEKDIVDDEERNHNKYREEMIDLTGQLSTPTLHIGKEVLIGFDKEEVDAALKKAKA